MTWDSLPPPADYPNLLNQIKSGSHNVNLGATYSSNPYLVFNTVSPNNSGALGKVAVRQALVLRDRPHPADQGDRRAAIINPALTHILPPGTDGAQDVPANYNPYPYDPAKAKSMLTAAGFTPSHQLQLKFLYRSDSQGSTQLFKNIQPAGRARQRERGRRADQPVGLLRQVPVRPHVSTDPGAKKGAWDIAGAGWGPDWFGNSAVTWFNPLYSSPAVSRPTAAATSVTSPTRRSTA